jgi:hypothetical protein
MAAFNCGQYPAGLMISGFLTGRKRYQLKGYRTGPDTNGEQTI